MNEVKIEVCVDSIQSSLAAQEGGADRIELCDNLYQGGTTPSYGMIKILRKKLKIGFNVIIRPRGGDFLYSDDEYKAIKEDVKFAKELGAAGVVVGFLNPDGSINKARTVEIVELAQPMPVTFHRAFDMCADPYKALEDIIDSGVVRLLTSGQQDKAIYGIKLLLELFEIAGSRIIIMPGSGITEENIEEIHNMLNAKEYHVSLRRILESEMIFKKSDIAMGGLPDIPEFENRVTDAGRVKALINIVKKMENKE